MAQTETGTIKWFDPVKGYGFIEREDGSDVFVHANEMSDPAAQVPQEGEQVLFEVEQGQKGPSAVNVRRPT
ncbi:MAG: cold shock domain-containing protein [Candidatus Promineifilaceae bacterium]|nr:cold shock domain-containing protein [Candidatus Promineifilaceae bacterium]